MKHKEIAVVLSQESIGAGIYSMWLKCPLVASDAKEGQFISLYCHDGSKILPRPISICEINKEEGCIYATIDLEEMYIFRDKCKVLEDIKDSYEVIVK